MFILSNCSSWTMLLNWCEVITMLRSHCMNPTLFSIRLLNGVINFTPCQTSHQIAEQIFVCKRFLCGGFVIDLCKHLALLGFSNNWYVTISLVRSHSLPFMRILLDYDVPWNGFRGWKWIIYFHDVMSLLYEPNAT